MNFIFPRSYLAGLTLSAAGGTGTFGVAAGQCTDDANTVIMNAGSSFTKTTAAFAEGTGSGALLDVGSIANSTWYHAFAMERLDTLAVDYGVSSSLTPTLPTNYSTSRRIGSIQTDASGHWWKFFQAGDMFLRDVPVVDINTTLSTTSALLSLPSVPSGVPVEAMMNTGIFGSTAALGALISSPLVSTQTANSPAGNITHFLANVSSSNNYKPIRILTQTAQIRAVALSGNPGFQAVTVGYIDRRGRDN